MTTAHHALPGARDRLGARAWVLLSVLSGSIFLEGVDVSMMGVALPSIRAELGMSTSSLQWVVSAYVLGYGGFVLLGGRAADLVGRRRLFLSALAVFVVFSGVGGLAQDGWVLVLARFVTGVSAGFMTPVGLSIITTSFPEGRLRNRALLVYAGAAAAGFSLGLVLSGLLTQIDWRWVFFAPVLLASVLLAVAPRVIPDDEPSQPGGRFDLPGALALTTGMLLVVYAIVQAPDTGWGATLAVGAAGVAALAAFVAVERRAAAPLVRLGLLRTSSVTRANVAAILFIGVVRRLPVRRRAVPAGAARLVGAGDRRRAAAGGHRRDPRPDAHAAARRALRPSASDPRRARVRGGRVRAVPAGRARLDLRDDAADDDPHRASRSRSSTGRSRSPRPTASPTPSRDSQAVCCNSAVQLGAALGLAIVAAIVVAVTGDASDPGAKLDGYRAGLLVPVAGVVLATAVTLPGALRDSRRFH